MIILNRKKESGKRHSLISTLKNKHIVVIILIIIILITFATTVTGKIKCTRNGK